MKRFIFLIIICCIALSASAYVSFPHKEIVIGSFSLPLQKEESTPVVVKDTLVFTGDIMLARNVEYLMNLYGAGYPFAALPELSDTAYLVGNFESSVPVVHVPTLSMQFSFSTKPEHLQGLREYGFTHLGLANNHAYDFGADDFSNTISVLDREGFDVFGDPASLATSSVSFVAIDGQTVALIGVYAVYETPSIESIAATFAYAEDLSDMQIAYVHFGEEYLPSHDAFQEKVAHLLVDAGADIVIGHHPHVVQDIEIYKEVPIFYSLGNFVFDQYFSDEVQTGLMVSLSFATSSMKFSLDPTTSIGSRSQSRLMGQYERRVFLEDLAEKSDAGLQEMIQNGLIEILK